MLVRVVVVLLALLVLAGCGGGSQRKNEEKTIRATVVSFLHNYARGDAKEACSLLTKRGRLRLFGASTEAQCEQTVKKQTGRHGVVATRTRNQLLGARATVVVWKSDTRADVQVALPTSDAPPAPLGVVKVGDKWLVSGPPKGG